MPEPDEAAPEPAAGPRTVLFDLDGVITVDDTFARFMRERYAGCREHIVQGSDHGLSNFAELLPEVLAFALE